MDAADLDRPENRRKVAAQAAAENANGERLNALTDAGRNLAEQATKNDEFDAKRLESWAQMLKSLDDIAQNRMPSVADLLKQSADAKADAKMAQSGKGGEQQPGQPGQEGQQGQPPQGEQKPGEPQTAQNSSGDQKQSPPGPKDAVPQEQSGGKSAPQIAKGSMSPSGKPTPVDPDAKQPEKAPSISLTESTMNKAEPEKGPDGKPKPPSAGKLGLPGNGLAAGPKKEDGEKPPPPESSAQESLDEGISQQKDLLAEFAKVSDQLSEILASLEASTFVKRFKAASREQQQLAGSISEKTLDAFGIVREPAKKSLEEIKADEKKDLEVKVNGFVERLFAKREAPAPPKLEEKKPEKEAPFVTTYAPLASSKAKSQSDVVKVIQSDLEAYYQRKPVTYFKKILGEMKTTRVVPELKRVGERAADNLSGNAIHGAEFWADTMDRWAEEMVKVADGFT